MVVQHLVVDSAGFIKNANIKDIGENIYTVNEVVNEIRDRTTRRRLAVLPYELHFKQPQQSSIEKIHQISKQTKDFDRLSATDIKLLALSYELTKAHGGNLKEDIQVEDAIQVGSDLSSKNLLPGFYYPSDSKQSETESESNTEIITIENQLEECNIEVKDKTPLKNNELEEKSQTNSTEVSDLESRLNEEDKNRIKDENIDNQEEEDDEEFDDNETGWITPSNIKQMTTEVTDTEIVVACMTTDFAMQNVLRKIGIEVVTIDGMAIKHISSAVLRCHACFQITQDMSKRFCPKCGNATLKRVPVTIEPDGTTRYYLSRNPNILNPRGLKYSLPMPKGGKHSNNPIVCEDQPIPQNRAPKKAMARTNVWDEDYNIDGSPFSITDTQSRAFRLGIRSGKSSGRRGNPNQNKGKFSRKR